MSVYIEDRTEQDHKARQDHLPLTRTDRRLLLGSSLRLLCRRFTCGKPIFHDDVIRLAALTDDAEQAA
jgi:hypothetical protein